MAPTDYHQLYIFTFVLLLCRIEGIDYVLKTVKHEPGGQIGGGKSHGWGSTPCSATNQLYDLGDFT